MSLEILAAISRLYGGNPDYVIAGGGNTSFKDTATLWIKASGAPLGEITEAGFVATDRAKLAGLWEFDLPENSKDREDRVLAELMAARKPGEENKRPSVETLLHDLLPFAYVVHTHPSLVNGLTCSRNGEQVVRELFGGALWIPVSDPGFVLASAIKEKLDERRRRGEKTPDLIFLQNHGIFVGADTPDRIKTLYGEIMDTLNRVVKRCPDFGGPVSEYGGSASAALSLQKLSGGFAVFARNNEIAALTASRAAFAPVSSSFTPDHIVYAGSDPLFIEAGKDIETAWKSHTDRTGRPPKLVALEGIGIFGIGGTEKNAALALELFTDTMKVAAYAESFGGPQFMPEEKIAFINNWEAEQYRAKLVT
ncbi:MAG: class II aldolase/adducin family protein [Treponema sp.]|jgi:rhamnose utilization protein RhaD (predicted bifunctional aldolase and dehydrogenase)|nr:class II aldolase/adducin family protein [Treponema sp.]